MLSTLHPIPASYVDKLDNAREAYKSSVLSTVRHHGQPISNISKSFAIFNTKATTAKNLYGSLKNRSFNVAQSLMQIPLSTSLSVLFETTPVVRFSFKR